MLDDIEGIDIVLIDVVDVVRVDDIVECFVERCASSGQNALSQIKMKIMRFIC
jgi:hypothetical protein